MFDISAILRKYSKLNVSVCQVPADNQPQMIKAYVESGEGEDRAGGFAIQVSYFEHPSSQADSQGLGGILIEKIEGNYDNCVGFPSAPFWRWLSELAEEGAFDEAW